MEINNEVLERLNMGLPWMLTLFNERFPFDTTNTREFFEFAKKHHLPIAGFAALSMTGEAQDKMAAELFDVLVKYLTDDKNIHEDLL